MDQKDSDVKRTGNRSPLHGGRDPPTNLPERDAGHGGDDLPERPGGGRSALGGGRRERRGAQSLPEDHRSPSGQRRDEARLRDRSHRRLDPDPGRAGGHGLPPVRGHRASPGAHQAFPLLRGSPDPAGRVRERRRPPLPGDGHRPVRHPPLPSRQRHLPSGPPGALQPARLDPARRRQPYPHLRRGGDAGHRRGRARRGRGHGRGAVLPQLPQGPADQPQQPPAALGVGQGHRPGGAPHDHDQGQRGLGDRVRRDRAWNT